MQNRIQVFRVLMVLVFTLVTVGFRFLPHPVNFTPVLALGLFAGTILPSRFLAMIFVTAAMLVSDAVVGFYDLEQMVVVYSALALSCWIGRKSNVKPQSMAFLGQGFMASFVFFVLTNSAVWGGTPLYPKTLNGLWMSCVAGLPFFHHTFLSTVVFGFSMLALHRALELKVVMVPSVD